MNLHMWTILRYTIQNHNVQILHWKETQCPRKPPAHLEELPVCISSPKTTRTRPLCKVPTEKIGTQTEQKQQAHTKSIPLTPPTDTRNEYVEGYERLPCHIFSRFFEQPLHSWRRSWWGPGPPESWLRDDSVSVPRSTSAVPMPCVTLPTALHGC